MSDRGQFRFQPFGRGRFDPVRETQAAAEDLHVGEELLEAEEHGPAELTGSHQQVGPGERRHGPVEGALVAGSQPGAVASRTAHRGFHRQFVGTRQFGHGRAEQSVLHFAADESSRVRVHDGGTGGVDDRRAGRGGLDEAEHGERLGIGEQQRGDETGRRGAAHQRHRHDRGGNTPVEHFEVGVGVRGFDHQRRDGREQERERVPGAHGLASAEDRPQHFQQQARLLHGMRAVLQVLGKIRDHAAQVTGEIAQGGFGEGRLHHGPVHAHFVERVDQAGGVEPVLAGGVAAFAGQAVQHEDRRAVGEQSTLVGVEGKFPAGAASAETKFFRRQSQALLHKVTREANDAAGFVHARAGVFQGAAAALGVHAHADCFQNVQRAFVDLRDLVLRKDAKIGFHKLHPLVKRIANLRYANSRSAAARMRANSFCWDPSSGSAR
ncbi:MAG: hypothetical protein PGMFKBFP_03411 [Anaerolineales bacterium]|nr:hypothetical protein [Anaerolineales bacterium]